MYRIIPTPQCQNKWLPCPPRCWLATPRCLRSFSWHRGTGDPNTQPTRTRPSALGLRPRPGRPPRLPHLGGTAGGPPAACAMVGLTCAVPKEVGRSRDLGEQGDPRNQDEGASCRFACFTYLRPGSRLAVVVQPIRGVQECRALVSPGPSSSTAAISRLCWPSTWRMSTTIGLTAHCITQHHSDRSQRPCHSPACTSDVATDSVG